MSRYEALVIGAGHNGLACAAYLAKAGVKVLVLEGRSRIGGMATTEELIAPGLHSDVHASGFLLGKLSPALEELALHRHGLDIITPNPNWGQVFPDGGGLTIDRDVDETTRSLTRYSTKDAKTWKSLYNSYLDRKQQIVASLNSPPIAFKDENLAASASRGYRFKMQSARSWVDETFEHPAVRTFFSSGALHAGLAPDDPLGGFFSWIFFSVVQDVGCGMVKGGMQCFTDALASVVRAHGGEILSDSAVTSIVVRDGRAVGVSLRDGEHIEVDGPIASNVDPCHLVLDLMGAEASEDVKSDIRHYEWGPSFFGLYAALSRPVDYKAGLELSKACYVHASARSIDDLARSFADIRAGLLPKYPMIGIINESAVDPGRATDKALMKFIVHFVPYDVKGDAAGRITGTNWDKIKEPYADALITWLDRGFLPGLTEAISARRIMSPVDYERDLNSSVRGTHQHGAYLPYQVGALRPIPQLGGYRSSIQNLYLCGAGSHPGSGISMMPGRNAATVICRDLGLKADPIGSLSG